MIRIEQYIRKSKPLNVFYICTLHTVKAINLQQRDEQSFSSNIFCVCLSIRGSHKKKSTKHLNPIFLWGNIVEESLEFNIGALFFP